MDPKGRYHPRIRKATALLVNALALFLVTFSGVLWAQEEVTSRIYRYRERVATGYYEGYEVSPRRARAKLQLPPTRPGLFPFGSAAAKVRIRARLPDSHRGLRFYERNTCTECHPREARDIHSARAGITCRQCHGPEPIASIKHYYSPMNPVRRHAYICSKCHEGANVKFAQFRVHEPPSGSLETKKTFPILFYASWGMLLLLVGTLAFFVPHTFMVGFRELMETRTFNQAYNYLRRMSKSCWNKAKEFYHSTLLRMKGMIKKKGKKKEEEDRDVP